MKIVDSNAERVEREKDNSKVSVEDILKWALRDVGGGLKAKKAFICIVEEGENILDLHSYRCGLTRAEELGYIEAFKNQTWKSWMEDAK